MSDNTTLNPGSGGDVVRNKDRSGVKTEIVGLDLGIGTGTENLMQAGQQTSTNSMPVAKALDERESITAAALSAWNSSTALNSTQNIFTTGGPSAVLVQLVQTSTLTAGAVTYEVTFDGTNWVTISSDAVIDPTSSVANVIALPYTVQASTNKPFLLLMKGAQGLRAKLSTQITGTGTVTPSYALLRYPAVQQVSLVTGGSSIGSLTAHQSMNLDQLNGTAIDQNSGSKSLGTLRVVLATDQPQLTNKLLVSASDSLGQSQYNFPAGFVRTSDEPRQLFYDPFDSTLDTTNRWNAATSSGGGVAAAVSAGVLTLGTGTTASGYSHLSTQASFTPTIPGWFGYSFAIKLTDGAAPTANTYRFWGVGTVPGTPTTSAPLTDACGFEIDTAGKMYAVVYAAGTRTVIQDLSSATGNSKQPTDANYHRFIIYYRTDKTYFYIDALDTPVATANFTGPTVQTLPLRFLAIAAGSAPAASGVITCTGVVTWDTGKNNTTLSDGTYGWRKASVSSGGALKVDNSGVTQPISGTVATNADGTTGSAVPSKGLLVQGSDGTNARNLSTTTAGVVKVDISATAANSTPVAVSYTPSTTTGWTYWSTPNNNSNTALTTTVVTVKASAGALGGYMIYNPNSSAAFVQVFDVSGTVTLGTTRPNLVLAIPATSAANLEISAGIPFTNAIKVAATTTDSGSSAPTSGLTVSLWYK